jgi:hypothetical protein
MKLLELGLVLSAISATISDIGQGNHRKKGLSHKSFQQTLFSSAPSA